MANETRVRQNNQFGTLGSALNAAETSSTFDFGTAPGFGNVDSHRYIPITVAPGTALEEIVYLTAYTAGQTTGTVARGQEGTSAVSHGSGTPWQHAPTVADFPKSVDDPWGGNLGYDYEFDADYSTSPPSGWSWLNQTADGTAGWSATYLEQYGAGVITLPSPTTGPHLVGISQPLPSSWTTITAKIIMANAPVYASGGEPDFGFGIADSSGRWYELAVYAANVSATHPAAEVIYWDGSGGAVNAGPILNAWPYTLEWYGRIIKGATTWEFDISIDGRTWVALDTAFNPSSHTWGGASRVGVLGNPYNLGGVAPQAGAIGCEWLRVR